MQLPGSWNNISRRYPFLDPSNSSNPTLSHPACALQLLQASEHLCILEGNHCLSWGQHPSIDSLVHPIARRLCCTLPSSIGQLGGIDNTFSLDTPGQTVCGGV